MKRSWLVKVAGKPPFTMILMEDGDDPEHVCRCIFGSRFIWVK